MIKKFLWILFGLICMVQLGVVATQIISYERILKEGEVFYFEVLPIDPYDPFRGRYVTLRFKNASVAPLANGETLKHAKKGFAILEHMPHGDGVKEVSTHEPKSPFYLKAHLRSKLLGESNASSVSFSLPFDRFYMREDIAPEAERVLRLRSGIVVKAKLRVLNGKGVIEDLLVGDVPLATFVHSEAFKTMEKKER